MDGQIDSLELRDQLESFQSDMNGFTALMHLSLEGIRTDSVGLDEIRNSFAMLYQLVEILTQRMEVIRSEITL